MHFVVWQKYLEVVSNAVCNKAVCQVKDDGFELSTVWFSMVTGIDNSNRYRQISNTSCTKSKNLKRFSFHPAIIFAQSIEARCWIENEDVVGAAPTGDAPTTSEWSVILMPTKVHIILEILRCFELTFAFSEALKGDRVAGIILWICPVNERLHYNVTPSLIGWAYTQNDPWSWKSKSCNSALLPFGILWHPFL